MVFNYKYGDFKIYRLPLSQPQRGFIIVSEMTNQIKNSDNIRRTHHQSGYSIQHTIMTHLLLPESGLH